MTNLYLPIEQIPNPEEEFVAWIDIMGIRNIFKKVDKSPTLYILKLHKTAYQILGNYTLIGYYPVIDGFFITCKNKNDIVTIIKEIFINIASEFLDEKKTAYKFMIRAGLAFGNVIHGSSIKIENKYFQLNEKLKNSLLFGKAIVDAVTAEKNMPPFSVNIHKDSIKYFSEEISIKGYLKWDVTSIDIDRFKNSVVDYYIWRENNPHWVDYPSEKKSQHLFDFLQMLSELSC